MSPLSPDALQRIIDNPQELQNADTIRALADELMRARDTIANTDQLIEGILNTRAVTVSKSAIVLIRNRLRGSIAFRFYPNTGMMLYKKDLGMTNVAWRKTKMGSEIWWFNPYTGFLRTNEEVENDPLGFHITDYTTPGGRGNVGIYIGIWMRRLGNAYKKHVRRGTKRDFYQEININEWISLLGYNSTGQIYVTDENFTLSDKLNAILISSVLMPAIPNDLHCHDPFDQDNGDQIAKSLDVLSKIITKITIKNDTIEVSFTNGNSFVVKPWDAQEVTLGEAMASALKLCHSFL